MAEMKNKPSNQKLNGDESIPIFQDPSPGEKVLILSVKNRVYRLFLEEFGILRIAEDVHDLWQKAGSEEEKNELRRWFKRELIRAIPANISVRIGFEAVVVHELAGNWWLIASLPIVVALAYIISRFYK